MKIVNDQSAEAVTLTEAGGGGVRDDTDIVLAVWRYTAGWFQRHTALPNSTLLRPLPGQDGDFSVVNHASWPRLRSFLPALLLRPSFRTFVLANFKANGVAAQPIMYRRVPVAAGTGRRSARSPSP